MTALVDTNVILDVILQRDPFHKASSLVLAAIEQSVCEGCLCATTLTNIHYIASRHIGKNKALECISTLTTLFEISPVNRQVIKAACDSKFNDFEDAVLHASAVHSNAGCIVTRNVKDFKDAQILVFTPEQFLASLAN